MRPFSLCLSFLLFAGCGDKTPPGPQETLVPVSGTVTFGGKPADNVLVTFTPSGSTKGRGGSSLTEASGKFAAVNSEKKVGLVAGEYVVTFSRWRTADGSLPPGDKPPIITGAQETIPATWREPSKAGTHNTVKIPDAGTSSIEFVVPSE